MARVYLRVSSTKVSRSAVVPTTAGVKAPRCISPYPPPWVDLEPTPTVISAVGGALALRVLVGSLGGDGELELLDDRVGQHPVSHIDRTASSAAIWSAASSEISKCLPALI